MNHKLIILLAVTMLASGAQAQRRASPEAQRAKGAVRTEVKTEKSGLERVLSERSAEFAKPEYSKLVSSLKAIESNVELKKSVGEASAKLLAEKLALAIAKEAGGQNVQSRFALENIERAVNMVQSLGATHGKTYIDIISSAGVKLETNGTMSLKEAIEASIVEHRVAKGFEPSLEAALKEVKDINSKNTNKEKKQEDCI